MSSAKECTTRRLDLGVKMRAQRSCQLPIVEGVPCILEIRRTRRLKGKAGASACSQWAVGGQVKHMQRGRSSPRKERLCAVACQAVQRLSSAVRHDVHGLQSPQPLAAALGGTSQSHTLSITSLCIDVGARSNGRLLPCCRGELEPERGYTLTTSRDIRKSRACCRTSVSSANRFRTRALCTSWIHICLRMVHEMVVQTTPAILLVLHLCASLKLSRRSCPDEARQKSEVVLFSCSITKSLHHIDSIAHSTPLIDSDVLGLELIDYIMPVHR